MKTNQIVPCRDESTAQTSPTKCQMALMGEYGAALAERGAAPAGARGEAHASVTGGVEYGSPGDPFAWVTPTCAGGVVALGLVLAIVIAVLASRLRASR